MTPSDRKSFLSDRKTGVGGSDVASVFGIGYGCRRCLWYDKRGIEPDYDFKVTGPIELGNWLEPFIAKKYEERSGRRVETRGLLRHPEYPELIVHVDRVIFADDHLHPGVLEIKAVGRGVYNRIKREGMPEDYVLQLQHGMLVTQYGWGSFAVMNRDDASLRWWDVDRDETVCGMIKEEIPIFWATVENGPAPEMLEPDDKRCQKCQYRRQCQGAALIELTEKQGESIEHDESMRPLLVEYVERKEIFEEAGSLLDETKETIRTAMGDRPAVIVGEHPVYYRAQTSWRWDSEAMATAWSNAAGKVDYDGTFIPATGAAKRFKRPGESRPLRIF